MRNDQLKTGDAILYANPWAQFGIIKTITKDYVVVEKEICHELQYQRYVKKSIVKKIPKIYIKVSNVTMEKIKKKM